MKNDICTFCSDGINGISPKRILIKQDASKEGVIEIRRGLPDINLGENRCYAQIKIWIGVSQTFIKGMGLYSDSIPDDYDIIFHTRLKEDGNFVGVGKINRVIRRPAFELIESDIAAWDDFKKSLLAYQFLK
jgi:hypothetical protein